MPGKLKPLSEQVIVVTGASSALGLAIARAAAKAGAAVVVASGDEQTLRKSADEINQAGGRAHAVVGNVASADDCGRIARAAVARFGRFDSWIDAVGDAAGLRHAAREAANHFGERDVKGAIVSFGTKVSDAARAELRQARRQLAATTIRLPATWRHDTPADGAAAAALHAVEHTMGRMSVGRDGHGPSLTTQARQHQTLIAGVGLVAIVGAGLWFGRGRIAAAAKPLIGRALKAGILEAVRRRPLDIARLAFTHPREALKLVQAFR